LYTGPFGLDDIPNAPPKQSSGILSLKYYSNFVCNATEDEVDEIYHVDLTNPRVENIYPENDSTIFNNLRPTILARLDEVYQSNSGIDTEIVQMELNGASVIPNISLDGIDADLSFTPLSDLPLGLNEIEIDMTDNAGRNSIFSWFFYINVTSPFNISVYSPKEGNYSFRRHQFNVTSSDKSSKIEYINWNERKPRWRRLCLNCDEFGFNRKRTKTLIEGWNNISFRAEDMSGNVAEENVVLYIDSKPPKISRTEPRRNSVVNGSLFSVRYTEDYLENVEFVYNPVISLSNCSSGRNKVCSTSVDLSSFDNMSISYHFEVSDGINIVSSRNVTVDVDTSSPILEIHMPINGTISGRRVAFNISSSEEGTIEYMDNFDSRPRWRRLCNRCDSYGLDRKKVKGFRQGLHDVLIRARDEAGNSGVDEVGFTVV
jgi:hypothetical protein